MEELRNQISTKDRLIQTLNESLKLKDEQIETIKESLELKDEQIKTLESSIEIKDKKIETLTESLSVKEEQIKTIKEKSVDQSTLEEKEKKIKDLQNKIEILNQELIKADEDFEKMEEEIEKIKKSSTNPANCQIFNYTNIKIEKSDLIQKMREIIEDAVHSVMIVVPKITDLQDLYLYDIRSSVIMKVSCLINPGLEDHAELLEELESLDNISLRLYEGQDRFVVLKDGEELIFGVIGNKDDNYLVFHTEDSKHVKLFQSTVMETWLRSKKI